MIVYVLKYWDDEDSQWEVDKVTSNNEEALKWDSRGHGYCFNGYAVEVEELEKLAQAKEIIKQLLSCCRNYPQENVKKMEQAEQFLQEIKENE